MEVIFQDLHFYEIQRQDTTSRKEKGKKNRGARGPMFEQLRAISYDVLSRLWVAHPMTTSPPPIEYFPSAAGALRDVNTDVYVETGDSAGDEIEDSGS